MLTNLPAVLRQADLLNLTQEHAVAEHVQASGASTPEALLVLDFFSGNSLANSMQNHFRFTVGAVSQY